MSTAPGFSSRCFILTVVKTVKSSATHGLTFVCRRHVDGSGLHVSGSSLGPLGDLLVERVDDGPEVDADGWKKKEIRCQLLFLKQIGVDWPRGVVFHWEWCSILFIISFKFLKHLWQFWWQIFHYVFLWKITTEALSYCAKTQNDCLYLSEVCNLAWVSSRETTVSCHAWSRYICEAWHYLPTSSLLIYDV